MWDWLNYRYIHKWNRIGKSRNLPTHMWPIYFWHWKGNSTEREDLLNHVLKQLDVHMLKKHQNFLDLYYIWVSINYFYLFTSVCMRFLPMHSMTILIVKWYSVSGKLIGFGDKWNSVQIKVFRWTLCNLANVIDPL